MRKRYLLMASKEANERSLGSRTKNEKVLVPLVTYPFLHKYILIAGVLVFPFQRSPGSSRRLISTWKAQQGGKSRQGRENERNQDQAWRAT